MCSTTSQVDLLLPHHFITVLVLSLKNPSLLIYLSTSLGCFPHAYRAAENPAQVSTSTTANPHPALRRQCCLYLHSQRSVKMIYFFLITSNLSMCSKYLPKRRKREDERNKKWQRREEREKENLDKTISDIFVFTLNFNNVFWCVN